jgi:cytochrome c peroxidase
MVRSSWIDMLTAQMRGSLRCNLIILNPIEMNNPDKAMMIRDVAASDYAELFEEVWGDGSLDDVETAYEQVALSTRAFERTQRFGEFRSKYDDYARDCLEHEANPDACASGTGPVAARSARIFTWLQRRGFRLFMGENDNDGINRPGEEAMCVACHVMD